MDELIVSEFLSFRNEVKSKIYSHFFKTGKGEYGEGDKFLGLMVPQIRKLVTLHYKNLNSTDCTKLLNNEYHEIRLFALLSLVKLYEETDQKSQIYELYIANTKYINNWDLVDLSASNIIGNYTYNFNHQIIPQFLINSDNLWEQRISILATFYYIRKGQLNYPLEITAHHLANKHDLIQKACGWMLREVGKHNIQLLDEFIILHSSSIGRTCLRYSIEKMNEEKRQFFLKLNKK